MESAIKRMTIVSVTGNINTINDAWTTRGIRRNMWEVILLVVCFMVDFSVLMPIENPLVVIVIVALFPKLQDLEQTRELWRLETYNSNRNGGNTQMEIAGIITGHTEIIAASKLDNYSKPYRL